MGCLSFIETLTIRRLFGIDCGLVFKFWSHNVVYNKYIAKELILESCGINIYEDDEYNTLSQQKCIEKIWNEKPPKTVAKLLDVLSKYYCCKMKTNWWSHDNQSDYRQVQEIIERLKNGNVVDLYTQYDSGNLKDLHEDIEINIQCGKLEMVLDKIHTLATEYIRGVCKTHEISIMDSKGNKYPLQSLVEKLVNWYSANNYFESSFCTMSIQNTICIFDRFNAIWNKPSVANLNENLNKAEAEYVIRIIADTLAFFSKIENV